MSAERNREDGQPRIGRARVAAEVVYTGFASDDETTAPAVREEERIVVILDMVGSTGAAERLGSVRFHALLSDVFTRLSLLVEAHGGEVHRFVGDQLIATWPLGKEQENARAIQCVFACREALEAARCALVRRHGEALAFRAALHCGPLAAGEIGGTRPEVVLLGDAMNTAARIEQTCRATGHDMLVSLPLVTRTALPAEVTAASIGSHTLRGKSRRLELFALAKPAASVVGVCVVLKACA